MAHSSHGRGSDPIGYSHGQHPQRLAEAYGLFRADLDLGWQLHLETPKDRTNMCRFLLLQISYLAVSVLLFSSFAFIDNIRPGKAFLLACAAIVCGLIWVLLFTSVIHIWNWFERLSGQGLFFICVGSLVSLAVVVYSCTSGQHGISDALVLLDSGVLNVTVAELPAHFNHRGLYRLEEPFLVGIPYMVGLSVKCGHRKSGRSFDVLTRNICIAPLLYEGWNTTMLVSAWVVVAGDCNDVFDCAEEWQDGIDGDLARWHEPWKYNYAERASRLYGISWDTYDQRLLDLSPLDPVPHAPTLVLMSEDDHRDHPYQMLWDAFLTICFGVILALVIVLTVHYWPWSDRDGERLGHTCVRAPSWTLFDVAIWFKTGLAQLYRKFKNHINQR